jgi:FtsP/CotA-like multicopper oxidase with cupredoxin domain
VVGDIRLRFTAPVLTVRSTRRLNTPQTANPDGPFNLLLAPAERADVVIDFNGAGGQTFILYNDAVAPFTGGDARNEYFTGAPDQTAFGGAPTTLQGLGPNTRTLMKIVVTPGAGDNIPTPVWLKVLNSLLETNFLVGNQPRLLYNNGNPAVPGPVPYTGRVDRNNARSYSSASPRRTALAKPTKSAL